MQSAIKPGDMLMVAAAVAALLAIAILLLVTPTLNLDDLGYGQGAADYVARHGWLGIKRLLLNEDIGAAESRTYGLARIIQIATASVIGPRPIPTYTLIIVGHFASGAIVYQVAKTIVGDRFVAAMAALAWMASPAVLPLLKVQHHWLYLIAPYYALLTWLLLAMRGHLNFFAGVALLTATWLLGEGAIAPAILGALLYAWIARRWSYALQAVTSLALLCAYLGYQFAFVRDASVQQRFSIRHVEWDRAILFIKQILENLRAVLGLRFYDPEIGGIVVGNGALASPVFWLALTALMACFAFAVRSDEKPSQAGRWPNALVLLFVSASSLSIFAVLAIMSSTAPAVRYMAPYFSLTVVAMIVIVAIALPRSYGRAFAVAAASFSLALSISLLYRAEVLINAPNRALFAGLRRGTAIVIRHPIPENPGDGGYIGGGYPGLVSTFSGGMPNPMRSAWTAVNALEIHAGVTLAAACRRLPDGRIELFLQGASRGTFVPQDVTAVGLKDIRSSELETFELSAICR